ncbi:SRPBCC family protein [Naasia lichenicola]|uniref:Activator of Hsp90 ATPase homologue 1/2-like C-terminal domain-containing protein n=1 Tax=Naasia lichenicola TaxID=2565933 RepID=A0A4S4FL60_9MICO|nr:SRPBCC domain-containing protein [Naasia lichenicola]THG30055.1 hypothetical protein E6C64_15570 [Naasia lichenicola]
MRAAQVTRVQNGLDVTRELPADVPRIFRALSDPDELSLWWGPPGYPMVSCTIDFRPGGVWHYLLRGELTKEEFWARAVYTEIVEPTRLRYWETPSDSAGGVAAGRPPADVAINLAPAPDVATTTLTIRIRHRSALDRDRALKLGIESGLSRALDALDLLLVADSSERQHP